jgi:hypothetical protein
MARIVRADSFRGRVQRGLGSGYLEALERPAPDVEAIVAACLRHDPRVLGEDARARYLARIILDRGLDIGIVESVLAERPGSADEGGSARVALPLGVLAMLARAGRHRAVDALRNYVHWGTSWPDALEGLSETGDRAAWEGLDQVLVARFGPEAGAVVIDVAAGRIDEPWRSWREAGPLAPVLAGSPAFERPGPCPDLKSAPAATLLALVRPGLPQRARSGRRASAADVLADRVRHGSAVDRAVVEAALAGDDIAQAARAVQVLGSLGNTAVIAPAVRLLARLERARGRRLGLRVSILRGLEGLPAEPALDLARAWRDLPGYRPIVAKRLLEVHATEQDLPWALARLLRSTGTGDEACGLSHIVARFADLGPFPELVDTYRRMTRTSCRASLVETIRATDPAFGTGLAVECLFDCEWGARLAAVEAVDLGVAGVRAHVAAIAGDRTEEAEVRAAASARLDGASGPSSPPPQHPGG